MATHKSAEKANRQSAKRTAKNTNRRSRVRSYVKKVELAIASGDKKAAPTALREAQKELSRATGKKLIKPNAAARKLSRLNARVKAFLKA